MPDQHSFSKPNFNR